VLQRLWRALAAGAATCPARVGHQRTAARVAGGNGVEADAPALPLPATAEDCSLHGCD